MSDRWHRDLRGRIAALAILIGLIWIVAAVDRFVFGGGLLAWGIVPRTERGLAGIAAAPFLHVGPEHLIANTSGLAVFGGLAMLRGRARFWAVTVIGALASGAGTWLFGRPVIHVGASGVVYAYFGYLLLAGWFERRFWLLVLSVAVFLVWGPVLWGVVPTQSGISWEGHAFGLLGGVFAAWLLSGRR